MSPMGGPGGVPAWGVAVLLSCVLIIGIVGIVLLAIR